MADWQVVVSGCPTPPLIWQMLAGTAEKESQAREWKFKVKGGERVFIHPSSVNFTENNFDPPFMAFFEKAKTSKTYIRGNKATT